MKVAIVHEWLITIGGSERVLQAMVELFPEADIFTLFKKEETVLELDLTPNKVYTSPLNCLLFSSRYYQSLLPFYPIAVEQFDLRDYDLIISSSHAVAKGILTHVNQLHISYIHTPMRYAWDMYHDYTKTEGFMSKLKNLIAKPTLHYLRLWDLNSSFRPDVLLANSNFVAKRIQKIYKREATTIYPPVDTEFFQVTEAKEEYYFALSRFVLYKKIDLIIDAFRSMPEKQLYVAGDGPLKKQFAKNLPENVILLGFLPKEELLKYMQRAKAFVFAALEDFGIVPVEAQACGTPVIAYGKGGTLETVIDNKTGVLFNEQTTEELIEAIKRFENMRFDKLEIRRNSERFSKEVFKTQLNELVNSEWEKHTKA